MTYLNEIAKGEEIEALVGDEWKPATVYWAGGWIVYAKTKDGTKLKLDRSDRHVRKLP